MDASSSVESGLGSSGGASCSVPTSELVNRPTGERTPARSNRPRSRFPVTEAVVTTQRYTLGCALVSTLIVIVLFAITGAVWYRYVVRPGIMTAHTTSAGEPEPRVLVIVVQATDPKPPRTVYDTLDWAVAVTSAVPAWALCRLRHLDWAVALTSAVPAWALCL
ncbi:hypothetical protein MTO96_017377 [Rhipicephalus appendiculatus]